MLHALLNWLPEMLPKGWLVNPAMNPLLHTSVEDETPSRTLFRVPWARLTSTAPTIPTIPNTTPTPSAPKPPMRLQLTGVASPWAIRARLTSVGAPVGLTKTLAPPCQRSLPP